MDFQGGIDRNSRGIVKMFWGAENAEIYQVFFVNAVVVEVFDHVFEVTWGENRRVTVSALVVVVMT